jgi:hypothetical protein
MRLDILSSCARNLVIAIALASPATLHAQSDSGAARGSTRELPIRRIESASAMSKEQIGSITSVRELPDGRVLLNDGARRRLLLMDSTLATVAVVLDSLAEIENAYGVRPGMLIPYRGDSTLFIDPASLAVVVIDPAARIARVRSVWRVQDLGALNNGGGSNGYPAADAKGRIVYRIGAQPAPPKVAPPRGVPWFPQNPDSAFIVAIDIDTRKLDTLGSIRIPKSQYSVTRMRDGGFNFNDVVNPLPSSDDWAVLPDGVVAFVRAVDLRIEYRDGEGNWSSSGKLPFNWQRLSDEDRQHIVDSTKAAQERGYRTSYVTSMIRWVNQYKKDYPAGFAIPEGYRLSQGLSKSWRLPSGLSFPAQYIYACALGEDPVMLAADTTSRPNASGAGPVTSAQGSPAFPAGAPGGGGAPPSSGTPSCIPAPIPPNGANVPPMPTLREAQVMPATDLPAFRPPLTNGGSVRADADGNLWIRTAPQSPQRGGPVFSLVSRQGELVDRIQVPPGYSLVGFGKGKVVYLSMRDSTGVKLARVRLR